jgi:hypothetical protein
MKLNNNIENQFRDKLNQRTIEPSDKAWDRLDAMLSVSEKKKPKRGWLWMAASLAMLLTVGSLFFKNNSENTIIFQNDDNLVVEQNNVEETSPDTIIQENVANDYLSEQDLAVQKIEPNKQNVLNDTFSIRQLNRNFQQLALEETKTESIEMSEEYNMNNIYLTADELLSSVEETNNKSKDKPKVEVDYRFLLSQSEYEVEERYRKKAIDRFLQKKYEDVRVVISNKNH